MASVETVGGLLVDAAGRVLFGLRAPWKKAWPDYWDAPGGHVESGETLEQALVRELQEEIGVTATRFALVEVVEGARAAYVGDDLLDVARWIAGRSA